MLLCYTLTMAPAFAQTPELTAAELLQKAIAFHDPEGAWPTFYGMLSIKLITPDGKERMSTVTIDAPKEYFKLRTAKEGNFTEHSLNKGVCTLSLNGSTTFSEEEAIAHKLDCERAQLLKNYYTYLYGLPMKLTDAGTIIDSEVRTRTFKGKEYLVLKATYDETVGNDTWYFYFDPDTYAMEGYQFFHDEAAKDGEYILLSDFEKVLEMNLPKTRKWYYNKDDTHLGTDVLTQVEALSSAEGKD